LKAFHPTLPAEKTVLTKDMTVALPPVVQRWLERSNAIGATMIHTVHLQQKGEMRTAPEGKWMPVTAEQYFTVNPPGFIWVADMEATASIHLVARDKYQDGKGHMLIKALSLFPVADAQGPTIDQGSMLRYLAEMIWFPTSVFSDYIQWEQIDALTAKATMRYGGIEASGIFTFTPEGDVSGFDALRYYDRKTGATLEKWHIENTPNSIRAFGGIRIPTKSTVTWQLDSGDFSWFRMEISDVTYND
jgi:hypothetical protein